MIAVSAIIAGLIYTTSRGVARPECDYTDDTSVWSPDGKWLATATSRACPAGPLSVTNYGVFVTLRARPASGLAATAPIHIFDSDGAAEPPQVTWTGANELRLELKEEGSVRTSKHDVEGIRIKYVVPKWIWDSLGKIQSDRLRQDRESEELVESGKMTDADLRISLQAHAAAAEERATFRQWVLRNATVEGVSNQKPISVDD